MCGVVIQGYRGDNGVFKTKEFLHELDVRAQTIEFSGVGAHHQNGVAERAIRTVVESARMMMLHVAIHWPEQSDLRLWPFALSYAVFLYNRMPSRDSGLAPIEVFCGTKLDPRVLRNARVWGCPAYVLNPSLQDGKKIPKWQPRSRRGQFLGFSDQHSSTIGLIRNLQTGAILPQFHVVYDDFFNTIPSDGQNRNDATDIAIWEDLVRTSSDRYVPDWDDATYQAPPLTEEWLDEEERVTRREAIARRADRRHILPQIPLGPIVRERNNNDNNNINDTDTNDNETVLDDGAQLGHDNDNNDNDNDDNIDNNEEDADSVHNEGGDDHAEPATQPTRRTNPPRTRRGVNSRYHGNEWINLCEALDETDVYLAGLDWTATTHDTRLYKQLCLIMQEDEDGLLDEYHPLSLLLAKASSVDTPTLREAMAGDDREQFVDAMKREIDSLVEKGAFITVARGLAVRNGAKILGSMWALKRK
jgi:hypothetical protein